ncbi:MAG: hypothetical protein ACTTH5_07175 [Wolinella sp.]
MGLGVWINILFTLAMGALALADYRTFATPRHRDFKSIIMSTGVLGTFVGIFVGLLDFDTLKIEESVPLLLEGLKVAFYTSIVGMGLAILLSVIQKSKNVKSDTQATTDYFLRQASKLNLLESLPKIVNIFEQQSRFLEAMQEGKEQQHRHLCELLELRFGEIRTALEAAIKQLAHGASQEIVSALEAVIRDFNKNLSEQFGDNFKELNAATLKMLSWQENYKSSIEAIERNLALSQSALESSSHSLEKIHKTNSEVREFYKELGELIHTYKQQNSELSMHLESFSMLRERAQAGIEELNEFFNSSNEHLKSLSIHVSESFQKTQESLLESGRFLQEESHKEVGALLEGVREAHVGVNETFIAQSGELSDYIKEEMTHSRAEVGEQLHALKSDFGEFVLLLKTSLADRSNEVFNALQKSVQETQEHLSTQERIYKERGIELFSALLARFEELSVEIAQGNSEKIEEISSRARGFFEEFTAQWQGDHERLKEAFFASNGEIKGSFEAMSRHAGAQLELLVQNLKEGVSETKQSITKANETLAHGTLELLQTHQKSQFKLFGESVSSISGHLVELEEGAQKSLKNLALEYMRLLQKITKESVQLPKEASMTMISEFETLQKEVLGGIHATNQTLLKNRREIEGLLSLFAENIQQSLDHNNAMNRDLTASLKELDGALEGMINNFKRDYEWFLRRIRELIGSRSAF